MREVLLPTAGLDPANAAIMARVSPNDWELKTRVACEGARRMLSGELTRAQAEAWMVERGLFEPSGVSGWLGFAEWAGAGA
jgi:hypothetical protein